MRHALILATIIVLAALAAAPGCGDDSAATCPAARDCTGLECGPDPICMTSCGDCPTGQTCAAAGTCSTTPPTCPAARNCAGRVCGPDPVCLTSCGDCPSGQTCTAAGTCSTTPPTCPADRNCTGRACGPDPVCSTSCGDCTGGQTCDASGRCTGGPSCGDGTCNAGENCNTCIFDCRCPAGQTCSASGTCETPACTTGDAVCSGTSLNACEGGAWRTYDCTVVCAASGLDRCGYDAAAGGDRCICLPSGSCTTHYDCDDVSICVSNHCTLAWGRDYRFTLTTGHIDTAGCWDVTCGAPDTVVVIGVDGAYYWESSEKADTFDPSWYETFDVRPYESTTLQLDIWDIDILDSNDWITGTTTFSMSVTWLKAGALGPVPSGSASYVNFTIAPR